MIKAKPLMVAGVAAGLATLAVISASSTAQTPGARTFTLFEVTPSSTFRFIDNPPRLFKNGRGSVSAGDIATVRTPLGRRVQASCRLPQCRLHRDEAGPHIRARSPSV